MTHPQGLLFTPEELTRERLKHYEALFSLLDLPDFRTTQHGRPPVPRSALLKALVFKNLRSIPSLTDLVVELSERPTLAHLLDLDPLHDSPSVERFSAFLRDTPNDYLQPIRRALIEQLVASGEITGTHLAMDSCPIKANVKENNLKTIAKQRFDKSKIPKGDPDSRLGVIVTFPSESQKKIEYFWGYRNHIITDCLSELPVAETTRPANVAESPLFVPSLTTLQETFHFPTQAVMADAAFDSISNIDFVVNSLKAKPVIARNPRGGLPDHLQISRRGTPICMAGFEMASRGTFYDKKQNRRREKFICPIRASKKFAQQHPLCPWWHPKFLSGSGCITYRRVDVDENLRTSIDYNSEEFKRLYQLRTSTERVFSRLLAIYMQYPTVRGLNATANLCTIAHITVLSVALTAVTVGQRDKIRFVKSFIPNL